MQSMEQMYSYARKLAAYHPERLLAVLQGKDDSLPQAVAMAALKERKQAEMSQQGIQAMQAMQEPTPKDKLVAEYGPQADEESGVASLPAENMEFAGGGIVGFAEGGETELERRRRRSRDPFASYPASTLAVDPMTPRNTLLAIPSGVEIPSTPASLYDPRTNTYVPNPRLAMDVQDLPSMAGNRMSEQAAPAPSGQTKASPAPGVKVSGPGVGSAAPAGGSFSVSASRSGGASAKAGEMTPEDLIQKYSKMPDAPQYVDIPVYEKNVPVGTPESYIEEADKLLASRGVNADYLKEAEAKLRSQQERLPEERRRAGWEAIMQAGLATAAGKSRYALSNIAEGGLAGLTQYKESMKELKKDEKDLDRAVMDMRKAQYDIESGKVQSGLAKRDAAQARADTAEQNVYNSRVRAAEIKNSLKSRDYGISADAASRMNVAGVNAEVSLRGQALNAQLEREKMALQSRIASMRQAGASQDELKPFMLKGMDVFEKMYAGVPDKMRPNFMSWFLGTGIPQAVSPAARVTPPKN